MDQNGRDIWYQNEVGMRAKRVNCIEVVAQRLLQSMTSVCFYVFGSKLCHDSSLNHLVLDSRFSSLLARTKWINWRWEVLLQCIIHTAYKGRWSGFHWSEKQNIFIYMWQVLAWKQSKKVKSDVQGKGQNQYSITSVIFVSGGILLKLCHGHI
jgi:hypothetical protein